LPLALLGRASLESYPLDVDRSYYFPSVLGRCLHSLVESFSLGWIGRTPSVYTTMQLGRILSLRLGRSTFLVVNSLPRKLLKSSFLSAFAESFLYVVRSYSHIFMLGHSISIQLGRLRVKD